MKLHVVRGFELSKDPMFAEKVRGIVGLNLNLTDKALVFPVEQTSQC